MTAQAWIFLVLVFVQLVGTVVFVAVYRRSDWRATEVGRHLMFYSAAAGAIDAAWLLIVVARWPWLMWVLYGAQAVFAALIWQRVRLVWRAQHHGVGAVDG